MNDLMILYNNIDSVRLAVDMADLTSLTQASRESIGELLLNSAIGHEKHAQLYTLLYEVWIARRLEIERLS
ncbi:hypothetical protein D9M71_297630 [compost metagenome]